MHLVEKIQWIQAEDESTLTQYIPHSLQDVMVMINKQFMAEIHDHIVLRKIIEA